jgi:hypothetical protein
LIFAGGDDALYAASATIGALWKIDPVLDRATKMALTRRVPGACALHAARAEGRSSVSNAGVVLYVAGGFRDGVKQVCCRALTDLPL